MGAVVASGLVVLISCFTSRINVATGVAAAVEPVGGIIFHSSREVQSRAWDLGRMVRVLHRSTFQPWPLANLIVRESHIPRTATRVVHREPVKSLPVFADLPDIFVAIDMFSAYLGFIITASTSIL